MGLRELKETAHAQYVRGKFGQCAETYQQILKLAPKDPNMRVRHAEACRRAGNRQQAITSYRMAADLLLAVGCESRARGAIKAALELDPKDPVLLADLARLGPSGTTASQCLEERASATGLPGALEPGVGSSAPARSMTSTGVPAPRPMTLGGLPAPRSMTAAILAAVAPGRALASPPPGASPASAPPRRPTLALPPAPASTPARPSVSMAGPLVPRTPPPLPSAARDPAWAAPGAFASAQGASRAPVTPAPTAPEAPPTTSSVTPPPAPGSERSVRLQVEVRRLSPQAVAFRLSPQSRWVLFTSRAPISVSREDSLDAVPRQVQQARDFTLDITVEEPQEEGSAH